MRWPILAVLAGAVVLAPGSVCAPARGAEPEQDPGGSAAADTRQDRSQADLPRLKAAFDQNRRNDKAALDYAGALLRANQPEAARPILYGLLQHPGSMSAANAAEAWFHMGLVHLRAREYDEAIACWNTVLRDFGGTERASGAAVNIGAVLYQVRDETARAYDMLTARMRDGTIREPHLEIANLLRFQIHLDRREYAQARGLMGALPRAGDRYEYIKDAIPIVFWKTGDEATARALLDVLYANAKDSPPELNNLAATLAEHSVGLDLALAWAERAVELPEGARHDSWHTLADVLFQSGQLERAIEAEEKAVALATAPEDRAEYGARLRAYRAAAIRKEPRAGRRGTGAGWRGVR